MRRIFVSFTLLFCFALLIGCENNKEPDIWAENVSGNMLGFSLVAQNGSKVYFNSQQETPAVMQYDEETKQITEVAKGYFPYLHFVNGELYGAYFDRSNANCEKRHELCRINIQNGVVEKLGIFGIRGLFSVDDDLFVLYQEGILQVDTKTDEYKQICKGKFWNLAIIDQEIYYLNRADNQTNIYAMALDGSNQRKVLSTASRIEQFWIYRDTTVVYDQTTRHFYVYKQGELLNDMTFDTVPSCSSINLLGDHLIYSTVSACFLLDLNTYKRHKISNDAMDSVYLTGGKLYCYRDNSIIMMDWNGKHKKTLYAKT